MSTSRSIIVLVGDSPTLAGVAIREDEPLEIKDGDRWAYVFLRYDPPNKKRNWPGTWMLRFLDRPQWTTFAIGALARRPVMTIAQRLEQGQRIADAKAKHKIK